MTQPKRLPIVTLALIGASIVAAFLAMLQPDWIDRAGFSSQAPNLFAAFASIFFHANLIHLLGNMVFLAAVGPAVEFAAGAWKFLATFLAGGAVGVLAHWAFTMRLADPPVLVGASGAIASCVAYFSVRYFSLRVPLAPSVSAPVWSIALVWLILQVVGAFVRIGDSGSVAFWAHLGGFATGLLMSLIFQAPKLANVQFGHDVLDQMNARSPAAALTVAEKFLATHPDDPKALRAVAQAHRRLGHDEEEIAALLAWLKATIQRPGEPLSRLAEIGRLHVLTALQRTRLAEQVASEDRELASRLLESVVQMPDDEPQKPDAMLALAELNRSERQTEASAILESLADKYPFHAATEIARAKGWLA